MDYGKHPLTVVIPVLRDRYGPEARMKFCTYDAMHPRGGSVQHSIEWPRTHFNVSLGEIDGDWMRKQVTALQSGWELGIHSHVVVGDKSFHLAMVDCSGSKLNGPGATVLADVISHWDMDYLLFHSGRSYHLYGSALIPAEQWPRFMGSLLLCAPFSRKARWLRRQRNLVDRRWVGHQLISGRAVLRWSNNSERHDDLPTLIGALDDYRER